MNVCERDDKSWAIEQEKNGVCKRGGAAAEPNCGENEQNTPFQMLKQTIEYLFFNLTANVDVIFIYIWVSLASHLLTSPYFRSFSHCECRSIV